MMPDTPVYQYSLPTALLDGSYDGDLTVSRLLEHGNFGLGTFNGLDGEMVVIDGYCYQMLADGTVREAEPTQLSPFAVVTNFTDDIVGIIDEQSDYSQLLETLDSLRFSDNYMYAIRLTGEFEWVKTRAIPRQEKPYRPMIEVAKEEKVHEHKNVFGVVAGFYAPRFEEEIGVSGYHLHFIDEERTIGGHILGLKLTKARAVLAIRRVQHLELPSTKDFIHAELTPDNLVEQLKHVEGDK